MPEKETTKYKVLRLRISADLLRRLGNISARKGMPTPDLINLVLLDYAESEELELDGNFMGSSKGKSTSDTD